MAAKNGLGAHAKGTFEHACEMGGLFVAQEGGGDFYGAVLEKRFSSKRHASLVQPLLRCQIKKVMDQAIQLSSGHLLEVFAQPLDAITGWRGHFRPSFKVVALEREHNQLLYIRNERHRSFKKVTKE